MAQAYLKIVIIGIALTLLCFVCTFVSIKFLSPVILQTVANGSCIYDTQFYNNGDSFASSCNVCRCTDGQVSCTKMYCEELTSSSSSTTSSSDTSSSNEPVICWNRVIAYEDENYWPDGCGGITCELASRSLCTQSLVQLTDEEKTQYESWRAKLDENGNPISPRACNCI